MGTKTVSSVLGHTEKPGKVRIRIRWHSLNTLRARQQKPSTLKTR